MMAKQFIVYAVKDTTITSYVRVVVTQLKLKVAQSKSGPKQWLKSLVTEMLDIQLKYSASARSAN
jgi:hypothetical protein